MQRWTDKYACYNKKEDCCTNYKPIMHTPSTADFINPKKRYRYPKFPTIISLVTTRKTAGANSPYHPLKKQV